MRMGLTLRGEVDINGGRLTLTGEVNFFGLVVGLRLGLKVGLALEVGLGLAVEFDNDKRIYHSKND